MDRNRAGVNRRQFLKLGAAGLFYGLFVLAVAIHAALGIRVIAEEWFKLKGLALQIISLAIGFGLLAFGGRAVFAVVGT